MLIIKATVKDKIMNAKYVAYKRCLHEYKKKKRHEYLDHMYEIESFDSVHLVLLIFLAGHGMPLKRNVLHAGSLGHQS